MEFEVRGGPVHMAYPVGFYHAIGLILLIGALPVIVGCGGGDSDRLATYPATGEVVFSDGTPLRSGGRVEFRNTGTTAAVVARGFFGDDGKFQLETYAPGDGAVEGEHQVVVLPDPPDDDDVDSMTPAQLSRATHPIEGRFSDYRFAMLKFTVTKDATKNHFRIEVWPPGKGPQKK